MGHYRPKCVTWSSTSSRCPVQDQMTATATEGGADEETARCVLQELAAQAAGPLGESFVDADRNPPVFDPATHRSPCRTR